MRFFVAGATGYTGRSLVRVARAAGVEVVAHIRPDSSSLATLGPEFRALGAELVVVPWAPDALREALAGCTHVFALLGTTASKARAAAAAGGDASYDHVDVGLTRMLHEAASAVTPEARFVYLSSAGVDGAIRNAYLAARFEVEQRLQRSALPWTIARPSFITGADRPEVRTFERVAATATEGLMSVFAALGAGRLADRVRPMDGTQLARALMAAALDDSFAGKTVEADELRRLST